MQVTNAKKGSQEYLIDWCDYVINDLVKEKTSLFKAYNYFNGVRDHYQYEHLEKNEGVGNPTSVSFTPLTRKHIEALVGEYLSTKPKPKVACKDERTLTNIFREKLLEIGKQLKDYVSKFIENSIYTAIAGQQLKDKKTLDAEISREEKEIIDSVNRNFLSNYEIAAQDIIQYVIQNRQMDFINKIEQLFLDLLIAGQAYFKIVPSPSRDNFRIEICDPLNTWIDKDPKSRYMKSGYKSVVRKWMTAEEIEIKYGEFLTSSDIDDIRGGNYRSDEGNYALITGQSSRCGGFSGDGIWANTGIHPYDSDPDYKWDLIPVYETEWIDSYKMDNSYTGYCYHVTRIGQDIYIMDESDVLLPRQADAPNEPRLSINGIWYTNGHGAPYSLMLATADLLDNYDLLNYKLDNLIALSGTAGAIVDLAALPEVLGDDMEERIIKYQAYRKAGLSIMDSSQEGQLNINTIYNGFNDTQGLQAIQYILLAIQHIEDTVSSITGVFRERLGGIQLRDAVANVEVGMQQSYIITKRYYNAMDTLVQELLTDCIDVAKVVYKNGFTGQIVLGDQQKIFTLLPQYYSFTSYDITLADSAEIIKEQELIKQLAMQLASSSQVDPEILLIVSTSKSLTEMKQLVKKSIREKKLENSQINQLTQQLEEAQKNMKKMQQQLEESTRKIAQLNEKKLAIEQNDAQMRNNIDWYKAKSDTELKKQELELIKQRNNLEAAQLLDDNPRNDEVLDRKI